MFGLPAPRGCGLLVPICVASGAGATVGSMYPMSWVREHPHVKAARALLDGGILHHREVAEIRQLAGAAYDFSKAYLRQSLPESSAALSPWLVNSAAVASMALRRA